MKSFLVFAFVFTMLQGAAWAAEAADVSEEGYRYTKVYYDDVVAEDGTEVIKTTIGMTVLRPDSVEEGKEYAISHSTSAEKIDILEAYTQKPDGRRIDAQKNSFQISIEGGREGAAPAFSDQTTVRVVFPDVAVGDTVNVVYNRIVTDPLFPRHFADLYTFSRWNLYDDVRVSYSIPLSLNARYKSYDMTETENRKDGERQYLSWSFKNAKVDKTKYEPASVWEIGDEPSVAVSTFPSYQAVAESYGARAKTKAVVTDEIQKLADDITKGITDPKEQARALYNWEIDTLTYAGNCIGIGAVVPRNLDFVLKNKMGDCKDHATLLQTLLQAKGITSTQALIGVNSAYKLPEVPIVSVMNHVINYIPSMDLYLDATSGMPFGTLPFQLTSKPVLLVDGYKEGTMTPKRPPGQTSIKVDGTTTIAADGSAEGSVTVTYVSAEGGSHSAQQRLKGTTEKMLEDAGQAMLRQSGFQGSVTVDRGVWDDKNMSYTNTIRYSLKDFIRIGTPGAIGVASPFSPQPIARSTANVIGEIAQKDTLKPRHGFLCGDPTMQETYKFVFPPELKILAVPDNVSAKTSVQNYEAKYVVSGQTLNVSRSFVDTSPIPVCPAEVDDAYRELAPKIWDDMKAQIVYK
jgi:transglutaminase-like putative cysteine protease